MHGKTEESLDLAWEWVEGRGWFREVLKPKPSVGTVLAGRRETRRVVRGSSPNPTDYRVRIWSPKGARR